MNAINPIAETADTVTLSRTDYETLLEALEDAEAAVALDATKAEEDRTGRNVYRANCLPVGLVERMVIDGESPVRIWREHRSMTAKALAAAAGISQAYLSEIETGRKPGSLDAMGKLARALGVLLDDLAAGGA
ncbi:MAG: helix-turn-helix transcriptional regulator [Alphaproteobacteria bacterium]|nr:helix-turn-helix transcriptional regulator [Alphaproteobacteria bacterium]